MYAMKSILGKLKHNGLVESRRNAWIAVGIGFLWMMFTFSAHNVSEVVLFLPIILAFLYFVSAVIGVIFWLFHDWRDLSIDSRIFALLHGGVFAFILWYCISSISL